jgi:hypothetical protein
MVCFSGGVFTFMRIAIIELLQSRLQQCLLLYSSPSHLHRKYPTSHNSTLTSPSSATGMILHDYP